MVRRLRSRRPTTLSPFQRFYLTFVTLAVLGPFVPLVIASFAFRWSWPSLLPTAWWIKARATARLPLAWDYVFSTYSQVMGKKSRWGRSVVDTTVTSTTLSP